MMDSLDRSNPKFTSAAPKQRPAIAYPIDQGYPLAPAGDQAMQALESIRETATPVQRAIGVTIRVIPFAVCWLVLAMVLAFALLTASSF